MSGSDNKAISDKLMVLSRDLARVHEIEFLLSLNPEARVTEWYLAPHEGLHLCGNVVGHPDICDGPFESSKVWYVHEELKLARTMSRWFRLGAPLIGARSRK